MADTPDETLRRSFLKAGAGALGSIALSTDVPAAQQPQGVRRPNLIYMTTDGRRPDALSLNGNRILQTPNFDRIGLEGTQFRNSFVTNALCLPSRATALTGLYGHNTGCVDNGDRSIPADVPLFTDLLRDAGYEVGATRRDERSLCLSAAGARLAEARIGRQATYSSRRASAQCRCW